MNKAMSALIHINTLDYFDNDDCAWVGKAARSIRHCHNGMAVACPESRCCPAVQSISLIPGNGFGSSG
jgi:hypothetical protein